MNTFQLSYDAQKLQTKIETATARLDHLIADQQELRLQLPLFDDGSHQRALDNAARRIEIQRALVIRLNAQFERLQGD